MEITGSTPAAVGCAFVSTMGALHAGHQSLIQIARELSNQVVVSVFVNPRQFESQHDLTNYPKTPERDEQLARAAGATILWRPDLSAIYPGDEALLSAGPLGDRFEGVNRPGHFDGVLTVVNRLFQIVQPKFAIFGEKDFQQLFLIREMAAQLHPEIEIIAAPTIRQADGLALSSRNLRLSAAGRSSATVIGKTLSAAAECERITDMRAVLATLADESNFKLDYAEVIDESTFEVATEAAAKRRAIVAGWVDGIRLIDNMSMQPALVRA